jgi:2,3-diketo-5-methylthio-1-phosphopentane phosphatase
MSSTDKDYRRAEFSRRVRPATEETETRYGLRAHLPPWAKNPPAVLCDFDDTTAVENVAELLLEHFSDDATWQQLRRQSREKTIAFREYQERAFSSTRASREAMVSLVKSRATMRPYFRELWQYCQDRDIPLAIVTVGLDFYVDALLEREGLEEVPRYAVKTSFTHRGITYGYPHTWDGSGASTLDVCRQWGNCKCSVLGKYRRMGHSIFYVGDGRSDFCPASIADQVFARSHLAELCREDQMPYTEFEDFQDVIRGLEGWGAPQGAEARHQWEGTE